MAGKRAAFSSASIIGRGGIRRHTAKADARRSVFLGLDHVVTTHLRIEMTR